MQPTLPSSGNEPEQDPLSAAYQRLKEAYDAVPQDKTGDLSLEALAILTHALNKATKIFKVELERDLNNNTIKVNEHIIWKHESDALIRLATINGLDSTELLTSICDTHEGRITGLILIDSGLKQISPLSVMTYLRRIYLDDNYIQDISPLSQLTKLTRVHLCDNQLENILPLSRLRDLTELYLNNNKIRDISPLSKLSKLRKLYLSGNPISPSTENREALNILKNQHCEIDGISL